MIERLISGRMHYAVTPNDSATLPLFSWLHIGGAGDVVVTGPNGVDATFKGLVAGQKLDVSGVKVKATGTTATFIVAVMAS